MKIYKYQLSLERGRHIIEAHEIFQILKVDTVYGKPYLWALVDSYKPKDYAIDTLFTGDDSGIGTHIGTTLHESGEYVLHHFIYL